MFAFHAENFMTGLRVVFDREKLSLGWKKFDCEYISPNESISYLQFSLFMKFFWWLGYSTENSSTRPLQNLSPAPSPGVAFEPSTSAEAPNPRSNHTQVVQTPRNRSSRSNSKISIIMSLLFFWAVLWSSSLDLYSALKIKSVTRNYHVYLIPVTRNYTKYSS